MTAMLQYSNLILHVQAALGPRTSVFLSDVETSTWSAETVPRLASKSARWLVTRGEFGADEVTAEGMQHLEAEKVGCAGAMQGLQPGSS